MSHREQADRAAVENLHALGTDTSKDHPVEFFLYFPTEWDACIAASQLMNLQFSTSVQYSEHSDQWLCLATKKIMPTSERLIELGNFLEKLALAHDGDYDGWGTPVIDENYPDAEDE